MPKILLLYEDHSEAEVLADSLQRGGLEVMAFGDTDAAARDIIRQQPDLLILDMDLPRFSGLELHECLKFTRRASDLPVIYLTSNHDSIQRLVAVQQGASAILSKDGDGPRLLEVALRVLQRKSESSRSAGHSGPSAPIFRD